ncbi:hypothetical protein WH47_03835, partial [Habropoda laboriosa]
ASTTMQKLYQLCIKILPNPPYSPNFHFSPPQLTIFSTRKRFKETPFSSFFVLIIQILTQTELMLFVIICQKCIEHSLNEFQRSYAYPREFSR